MSEVSVVGPVALVLAGGGARGAYEIGVLAELLPRLPEEEQPEILVGTSIGALNVAFLAARAHEPLAERMEAAQRLWRRLDYDDALRSIASLGGARRLLSVVTTALGLPGAPPAGLLDPAPLGVTLEEEVDFAQLGRNIGTALRATAIVATSGVTNLSVVFHDGGPDVERDAIRGHRVRPDCDQRATRTGIGGHSGRLSRRAGRPWACPGWYFDGGTRLNTPIKPAKQLGAEKVIVVALHSLTPRTDGLTTERRPDIFDGASQLVQAVLVDPLVNDVHTLAAYNEMILDGGGTEPAGRRPIHYMLIAPEDPEEIGRITAEVYRDGYDSLRDLFQDRDLALLGRILDAGASATHGDLLSYLFLTPELVERLFELGRGDARAWLEAPHDDGIWQLRRLH